VEVHHVRTACRCRCAHQGIASRVHLRGCGRTGLGGTETKIKTKT